MSSKSEVTVVIVPLPSPSHLNTFLHLSHIITSYGIPVHYTGSATHNLEAKLRFQGRASESATKIHFHDFQLPPYSSLLPNTSTDGTTNFIPLFESYTHLRQPVFQLMQELATKYKRVILIYDSNIPSVAQDIKLIPNAESYTYYAISAFTLFSSTWDSKPEKPFQLDSDVLPSCTPSHRGNVPPEILRFLGSQFKFLSSASGRLYNTSRLIEGRYVELLERLSANDGMKHFAIGPVNPIRLSRKSGLQSHGCLEWLDKQEKASVIYISFGSLAWLTDEQISELATGLEKSGQKFLWVLKTADKNKCVAEGKAKRHQLPEGFEERIGDQGLVIRDWAPQLDILAHQSTGGFISHCGWNSCMESIAMGVPIVAWPMGADQPKNSILVTEVLRNGILVRDCTRLAELVTSTNIENAIKTLMASEEGQLIRKRAEELGELVRGSVGNDTPITVIGLLSPITARQTILL